MLDHRQRICSVREFFGRSTTSVSICHTIRKQPAMPCIFFRPHAVTRRRRRNREERDVGLENAASMGGAGRDPGPECHGRRCSGTGARWRASPRNATTDQRLQLPGVIPGDHFQAPSRSFDLRGCVLRTLKSRKRGPKG